MGVRDKRNYVVSFMGYAPAENPEIAIYVVVDRPNVAKQDDAKHATRLVRSILTEVLPYLNIFMTEELSEAEIKELEELDMEIIMAATVSKTVSGNEMSAEESVSGNGTVSGNEGAVITNANGGDITSSIPASEDVGDTAPLTGVLLDPETGEPLNKDTNEDSPQ